MKFNNNQKKKNEFFYNNLFRNEWKNIADYGPSVNSRFAIMYKLLTEQQVKTPILDIGCGTGGFIKKIKKVYNSKEIIGTDFSKDALKIAKKKNPEVKFIKINLLQIPKKLHGSFSTIICSEVLEHIQDVNLAVKNLNRLLKKNGIIVLSVPYLMKHWTIHDKISGHFRRFKKNELEKILVKNNFKILKHFSWGRLIYDFYYKIIGNISPKQLIKKTGGENKFMFLIRNMLLKFVLHLFSIEYYIRDTNCNSGRRLFIVAKKKRNCFDFAFFN